MYISICNVEEMGSAASPRHRTHLPHVDAKVLWEKFCSVAAEQGLLGIKQAEAGESRRSRAWEGVFPGAEAGSGVVKRLARPGGKLWLYHHSLAL